MSWGTELWDRYDASCKHLEVGTDFLDHSVAGFVKERGMIEGEYAKKLRNLVEKYTPKRSSPSSDKDKRGGGTTKKSTHPRNGNGDVSISGPTSIGSIAPTKDDEYSYVTAYRSMLQEVGFVAGQHELLADEFCKENYKHVHEQVKRLRDARKRNIKEHQKHSQELKLTFKAMSAAKDKFKKAYDEQEKAASAYNVASNDGNVGKNELKKHSLHASLKTSQCDVMKSQYADQMLKANSAQTRFYNELLPAVLNELQKLEETRIAVFSQCLSKMVAKEREVASIIDKCFDAIAESVEKVDASKDASLVIEKYKTGDVPPSEFRLEDIRDIDSLLAKDAIGDNKPTNLNLYPKKRELEKQIQAMENELRKAQREEESLQKMMLAYQSQPKYGKSDNFKAELGAACQRVIELEHGLNELKIDHADVEKKLQSIQTRSPGCINASVSETNSPMLNMMQRDIQARCGSSQSSTISVASSGDSNHSGASQRLAAPAVCEEAVGSNVEFRLGEPGGEYEDLDPPPPPSQVQADFQPFSSTSSESSCTSSGGFKRCEALYNFSEVEESSIPMSAGDLLYVIENNCDGWTRVRRLMPTASGRDEGYVPSTYLTIL